MSAVFEYKIPVSDGLGDVVRDLVREMRPRKIYQIVVSISDADVYVVGYDALDLPFDAPSSPDKKGKKP